MSLAGVDGRGAEAQGDEEGGDDSAGDHEDGRLYSCRLYSCGSRYSQLLSDEPAGAGVGEVIAAGRLTMPGVDTAILQLYALVLYPHLIHSTYGMTLDQHTTERLIESGVDMFLSYYAYRDAASDRRKAQRRSTLPS